MSIKITNSSIPGIQPKEVQKPSTVNISSKDLTSSTQGNWFINGLKSFVQKILSILRCIFCCKCKEKTEELPQSKTETKSKELTVPATTSQKIFSQTTSVTKAKTEPKTIASAQAKTDDKKTSQTEEKSQVALSTQVNDLSLFADFPPEISNIIAQYIPSDDKDPQNVYQKTFIQSCEGLRQRKQQALLATIQNTKLLTINNLRLMFQELKALSLPSDPIQNENDPISILGLFQNAETLYFHPGAFMSTSLDKLDKQLEKIANQIKQNGVLPKLKKIHFDVRTNMWNAKLDNFAKGAKALIEATPGLEEVEIPTSSLTKKWIDLLASKKSLRSINLTHDDNGPSMYTFEELKNWAKSMPNLEKVTLDAFYVDGNGVIDGDAALEYFLQNCPKLRVVHIYQHTHPKALQILAANAKKLEELTLGVESATSQEIIALAKRCPNLRLFDFWDQSKMTGKQTERSEALKIAKESEAVAEALTNFTRLEELGIILTLTPKVLSKLSELKKLKRLTLNRIYANGPLSVPSTVKFNAVRTLNIANNNLTDEDFAKLLEAFPDLEELDISYSPNLTDKSLHLIAEKYPDLKNLEIHTCPLFSTEGANKIFECCPNIARMTVQGCPKIENGKISVLDRPRTNES